MCHTRHRPPDANCPRDGFPVWILARIPVYIRILNQERSIRAISCHLFWERDRRIIRVLPMISSSNFSDPDAVIFVLSVLLPTMSTTTDPASAKAEALDINSISTIANFIDNLNSIPLQLIFIFNIVFLYTESRKIFRLNCKYSFVRYI